MVLHATFRTGSIFEACDDLLQTGDAYSAEEKHIPGMLCGWFWRLLPLLFLPIMINGYVYRCLLFTTRGVPVEWEIINVYDVFEI